MGLDSAGVMRGRLQPEQRCHPDWGGAGCAPPTARLPWVAASPTSSERHTHVKPHWWLA